MDIRRVKELIELLKESGTDELETREGEESVCISRHSKTIAQPVYAQASAFATPVTAPAPVAATPAAVAVESTPATPKSNGNVVRLPMVGTLHRTASPTSTNFVEAGRSVRKGNILYIVEAIKMMGRIEAEVSDTIESILVENGQSIEFGQPPSIIA